MASTNLPPLNTTLVQRLQWLFLFLRSQLFTRIPIPDNDFTNQVIIITGSNTGIGLEAARYFVRLNAAKTILAVRNVAKGQAAIEDIIRTTSVARERLEVWQIDLADFNSVVKFGERVNQMGRLDVVISNAGILTSRWEELAGIENHVAINAVAPTLLAMLVLPKLRQNASKFGSRGRFSFVGSDTSYIADFTPPPDSDNLFEALNTAMRSSSAGNRYAVSKILQLYAVRYLASACPLTPESNVLVDDVTPGTCRSDLLRDDMGLMLNWIGDALMVIFGRTCEVGARTIVHAVSPDLGEEFHGRFLIDCQIAR